MTDPIPAPSDPARADGGAATQLGTVLARARWTIFWERLWPALATPLTAVGFFLAVSWLGVWLWLPAVVRIAGVVLFGLLAVASLVPLALVRFPSVAEGLRRLDLTSGLAHRPATAIADTIATSASDPWSLALWQAHVERARAAAQRLRAGVPVPRLARRDPYALRALVLVLLVATFFAAGGERLRRVTAAFDWHGVVVPANFRLDAWVSPPIYTGKPPVILPGVRPGERAQASAAAVAVPAGSVLVVRASGQARFEVVPSGGVAEAPPEQRPQAPSGTDERRFVITARGTASLRGLGEDDITWAFNAIPDKPPTIALAKDPEPQARGSLQLSYKVEDDYGVVDARASFAARASQAEPGRPLFDPPDFPLVLPQARTKNGVGQTMKDLTESPWAGADVTMTLIARDEANNEGRSAPFELRLPERLFVKPLARALIEQRRILALDADARDRVTVALDSLAIAPERYIPELGVYLGLRSIYWDLARAKSDDDLRTVVQSLWALATQLEDGNVSEAEQQLRAAQEALRQALERGASDEEIKKLMEDLRAALDKFLQALAEEMRKNPQMARPLDQNSRQLRTQDLRSLLDRLEQLARSGAKDAARQLLEQLQSMLENLQMARPGQGDQDDDDMMSSLDQLGDMIRKQQQLRDRTYQQGQNQRRSQRGQRGQQGQQGEQDDQNAFGDLQQNQQALRDQLKQLMEELKKRGLGQQGQQGQQGNDPLGEAGDAMGDAQGQLGEGNADGAVDSQGRALDAMRKGAQGLAQQLQQQMGQGPGPGQPGRTGPARAQQNTDPLGRPLRGRDYGDDTTVKVPGEIDVQRARRILEELRRRFADPLRPQIELDYIERLLREYQ